MQTATHGTISELVHTERTCQCGAPFSVVEWKPSWRGADSAHVNGPLYKLMCLNGHHAILMAASTEDAPVSEEPPWQPGV